jgi:hypothetical protein
MDTSLTFKDINLRIFQGLPVPQPFFQPRIEPWFAWHKTFNSLPEGYRNLTIPGLFDRLGASMRYLHYYTDMPDPVTVTYAPEVNFKEKFDGSLGWHVFATPFGDLVEGLHRTVDETWRTVDFPVKGPNDLKKLLWLYQHTIFGFSEANFQQGSAFVGERGVPQFWVPKSPYQALAQTWMKLPDLIYALADYRPAVEETMAAINAAYDPLYEQITGSGMVKILNFGENLHEQLLSPRYFERYLIPFYEQRAGQLRQAGIFTHVHLDGYFHALLKYLRHLPFDGLEALTPLPQGDVTLEEIKEHIGDKILLDGIPAVYFMDTYPRELLMAETEKIVRLFHPRLVLGVSDEVPEGAGEEAMDRVKMVAEWCKRT